MPTNLLSLVRDLQRRKGRRRRGLAVAEGVRLVEEALAAGVPLSGAVVADDLGRTARGAALLEALAAHAVPVEEVPPRALAQLADTDTPQGVLAVLEAPRGLLAKIVPAPGAPVLVVDAVQDPGNVGALLRTAFALGCAGAVILAILVVAGVGYIYGCTRLGLSDFWAGFLFLTYWMAAEQAMLLPVPYFHVVFTLPHALNPPPRAIIYYSPGAAPAVRGSSARSGASPSSAPSAGWRSWWKRRAARFWGSPASRRTPRAAAAPIPNPAAWRRTRNSPTRAEARAACLAGTRSGT